MLTPHATLGAIEVEVVDQAGQALPEGQVGEIWLRSPSVAAGYWARPEQTALTFGARLAGSTEPYLRTGDLGFRSAGALFLRGRLKDMVVVRGRNIYPEDVENTLRPVLGDRVAAFGVELDDAEALAVLYEVKTQADTAEVRQRARALVADTFGVELRELIAVPPRSIPTTTSGKVRRHECAARYRAGEYSVTPSAPAPAAPDPRLAEITAELTRLTRGGAVADKAVAVSELGLDSLTVIEFQLWFEQTSGRQLGLRELLDASPAELAALPRLHRPAPVTDDGVSLGQQSIWLQDRLAADPSCLVLSRALSLEGPLDLERLQNALRQAVARHPALRTRFAERHGSLRREITDCGPELPPVLDVSAADENQLRTQITACARTPIDLASGRLLRAALLRRGPQSHVLVLSTHHIVMDVWSLAVLFDELATEFDTDGFDTDGGVETGVRVTGDAATAASDSEQADFGEHVSAERTAVQAADVSELGARWRRRLTDFPPVALPTDHARPRVRAFRGGAHQFELGPEDRDAVFAAAKACGVSPATFLCAGYAMLLHRLTEQESFVLGYITAGRTSSRFRDTIGYFVNTLPLPLRIDSDSPAQHIVRHVDAEIASGQADAALPLARIAQLIGARGGGGNAALVTTGFAYQRAPGVAERRLAPVLLNHAGSIGSWGPLTLRSIEVDQHSAYFDLSLYLGEHDGRLLGSWDFDAELFEPPAVAAISDSYLSLVRAACRDVLTPVTQLPLASGAALAGAPEITASEGDVCAHHLFEQQAAAHPEAVALHYGDQVVTYGELNAQANQIARRLVAEGVQVEDRVAILAERTPNSIAAIFGVLKAGAAYVPLDPGYPLERLHFIVTDSGASILLTALDADQITVPARVTMSIANLVAGAAGGADVSAPVGPDNAAYFVYTSGSTGTPNGVIGLHRGIVSRSLGVLERFPITAGDVCCHKTAQSYFDSGGEIFLPLMS
ncbi:MAG: condensation domain-containing protein, partial [Jatrophihabitantaceae bacterium]